MSQILEIKKSTTKRLVMDILIHTDNLNADGKREARTSIPKEFFRGYRELKEALFASIEYGCVKIPLDKNKKPRPDLIVPTTLDLNSLTWFAVKKDGPQIPPPGFKLVADRYNKTPVAVSPRALKALAHFYAERQELIDSETEALDELEDILTVNK